MEKLLNFKKSVKKDDRAFFCVIASTVTGILNGIFGGGGGMVLVPILYYFLGYDEKQCHATAILVILPISVFSALFYARAGYVNSVNLITVGAGVVLGGIIGAFVFKKLSSNIIKIIFAVIMMVAGIKMVAF